MLSKCRVASGRVFATQQYVHSDTYKYGGTGAVKVAKSSTGLGVVRGQFRGGTGAAQGQDGGSTGRAGQFVPPSVHFNEGTAAQGQYTGGT